MPALNITATIEQGATFQREFTVTNPDNSPFDLSASTVTASLKAASGQDLAVFGINVAVNKITVELTDEQTALLPPAVRYDYKAFVRATTPDGKAYRIALIFASVI